MKTMLISCGTLENEVRQLLAGLTDPPEVVFMEAALHDKPTEKMRLALQEQLSTVSLNVGCVLLAYGLCGGAINGLTSGHFTLIIPRVDDCIPLLVGSRDKVLKVSEVPSFFLTAGWIKFSNQCYYDTLERMGEKKTALVYEMMLANYKRFLFIDTGAYDLTEARAAMADRLKRHRLSAEETPGDLSWLRQLMTGPWPEQEFLTILPNNSIR